MRTVDNYNFADKRALIRVDFNVPLNADFQITDDTRMVAALPTIQKILSEGGSVVLMSHLGRPKEGPEEKFSLKHLVPHLNELVSKEVKFAPDCIGDEAKAITSAMQPGDVVLLENLRYYKEETKGDVEFAKKLSVHGDVYVNDAFGTAHRAHASTTIVAQFFPNDKLFGKLLAAEIDSLTRVIESYQKPYTAIIGGAKVSSKITVLESLMEKVNNIIIAGGMAYTFEKAKGGKIGGSLVEDDYIDTAKAILAKAKEKNVNIYLPEDSIVADKFDADANADLADSNNIPDGWLGLDIGPRAINLFSEVIKESKTILWNGPMGVFEFDKFSSGTKAVADAIAVATADGAFSLVGGGDSVSAVKKFKMQNAVSYVSTGGGACLEAIEGKTLPGVAAILED